MIPVRTGVIRLFFIIQKQSGGRGRLNNKITFHYIKKTIMSDSDSKRKNRTSVWVAIGAVFLIILLIIWLTFADLTGDTDVAAFLAPYIVHPVS